MKFNADFLPSKSDDWSTPSELYNYFMDQGYLDPCPLNSNEDGLSKDFYNQCLFVNPPFSNLSLWVDWCIKQYNNHCNVVILMPARTDTKYFHKLLSLSPTIYFFEGRLKFGNSNKSAPFPTILVRLFHGIFRFNCYQFGSITKFINVYEKRT